MAPAKENAQRRGFHGRQLTISAGRVVIRRPAAPSSLSFAGSYSVSVPPTPDLHPGIAPDDPILRQISKPNGDLVIIFASGSVTVRHPGQPPRTRTQDGRSFTLDEDGDVVETTRPRDLPLDQQPLNVSSMAHEEIGRLLSNFAERRFTFHGKPYRSVEAWYQGLKWPDESKRKVVAKLHGPAAKTARQRRACLIATFTFDGLEYLSSVAPSTMSWSRRPSPPVLSRIREVLRYFLATFPRPVVHDTGRPERPGTALPGSKFARLLEEIREEHLPRPAAPLALARIQAHRPPCIGLNRLSF